MNTLPLLLIPALFLMSCSPAPPPKTVAPEVSSTETVKPKGTKDDPIIASGYIRGIEADLVTIEHGDIPGFMSAMTMPYRVSEPALLEAIEIDSEVTFSIEVLNDGYHIFSIGPVFSKNGS